VAFLASAPRIAASASILHYPLGDRIDCLINGEKAGLFPCGREYATGSSGTVA
jgi:hypothetical protein